MVRIILACLLVSACASLGATKTVCIPMRAYTPAQQTALALQLAAIPDGSAIALAMADYEAMRVADRACAAAKP